MLRELARGMLMLGWAVALVAQSRSPQPSALAVDEYAVYAAVIDVFQASKKSSHPVVADHTATFQCHKNCNGMEIGGCNGLRDEDETPAQRLVIVRRDLPQLNSDTTADFENKNRACSTVAHRIPTKTKYLLSLHRGDALPDEWDSPDYFFFSRVGFNADHTQALVAVGFFSGTDAKDSGGKYFFFVKRSDVWTLQGTSFVWQLLPDDPEKTAHRKENPSR